MTETTGILIRVLSVSLFFLLAFIDLPLSPSNDLNIPSKRDLQVNTEDPTKLRGSRNKVAENLSGKVKDGWEVVTDALAPIDSVVVAPESDPQIEVNIQSEVDSSAEVTEDRIEYIKLDPESELFGDVRSIIHNPEHRRIKITLTSNPKCTRPVLRGRLSGRALAIVHWNHYEGNIIKGNYEVPFPGEYFLEIIALFCEYHTDNLETSLVPGENHRLTAKGTVINVIRSMEMKGYWESSENVPLYTRWQPQDCRGKNERTPRCSGEGGPGNPEVFDKYRFRSTPAIEKLYAPFNTTHANYDEWKVRWNPHHGYNCLRDSDEECDLCSIGSSHSNRLYRMLTEATGTTKSGGLRYAYPEDIKDAHINQVLKRCKNVVVGFGQHDIAFGKTSPDVFAQKIRDLLKKLETHPRVFGRSVNYNPLGDEKLMSPPQDNRNPAFIDDYNDAVRPVYEEFNRPWIDTRWITEAMWDSATDWNHMHYSVEFVQAFHIADYLGISFSNSTLEQA